MYNPVKADVVFIALAVRQIGAMLTNVFLEELVLSCSNNKNLCQNLQLVELHRGICKSVCPVLLVIIVHEINTMILNRTVIDSKTNVGVVANHVKVRSGSDYL